MKPTLMLAMLLLATMQLAAQSHEKQEITKQKWNFGALPATTFDSDLGFQYGAVVELFHYGDGSRYPQYDHSLYLEVSRFTKGSSIYRFQYDSDRLFKGLQTNADIGYLTDQLFAFYGFNGYDAIYNKAWTDDKSTDYISRGFYAYDRKLFQAKLNVQGPLKGQKFRWMAGLNLQQFKTAELQLDKLNKGKKENKKLPDVPGLYEKYTEWGLIDAEEADGGTISSLKGGLIYDTRDFRNIPERGIWAEVIVEVAPGLLNYESAFTRLGLTHRQYFRLLPKKLSFAYRLAYQTVLGGKVPFYYLTQLMATGAKGSNFEGFGGSKSVRGILRNRVIGNDVAFGNLELRWRVTTFRYKRNNFFIGLNGFVDGGLVTGKHALHFNAASTTVDTSAYLNPGAENLHLSYGTSLKAGMNENFVVSFDYGRTTDKRDGTSGFYMGLNYLF